MAVDQNAGEVHWESASGSKIMKAADVAAGKLLSLVANVVVSEGVIFVAAHLKELVAKTGYNSAVMLKRKLQVHEPRHPQSHHGHQKHHPKNVKKKSQG